MDVGYVAAAFSARITWKDLYRRFLTARPGHRPTEGRQMLFLCQQVEVTRYRWRGYRIPTLWTSVRAAQTA